MTPAGTSPPKLLMLAALFEDLRLFAGRYAGAPGPLAWGANSLRGNTITVA